MWKQFAAQLPHTLARRPLLSCGSKTLLVRVPERHSSYQYQKINKIRILKERLVQRIRTT